MKVFERYYRSTVRLDWKRGPKGKTKSSYIVEDSTSLIQGFNAIWQPAVEYVEGKLSEMPPGNSTERLYFEALLGALQANRITTDGEVDAAALRQKIDGLVSKIDALKVDAPNGESQDYLETFVSGMNTFHNQIPVESEIEDTPPEEGKDTPDENEPPPEENPEDKGEGKKEGEEEDQPEESPNSEDELLKSLGLNR